MTLTLYIRDEFIDHVDVDVSNVLLFDQRAKIVWEFTNYLRSKYRKDIMLAKQWEILLTVKSKMNVSKIHSHNS